MFDYSSVVCIHSYETKSQGGLFTTAEIKGNFSQLILDMQSRQCPYSCQRGREPQPYIPNENSPR